MVESHSEALAELKAAKAVPLDIYATPRALVDAEPEPRSTSIALGDELDTPYGPGIVLQMRNSETIVKMSADAGAKLGLGLQSSTAEGVRSVKVSRVVPKSLAWRRVRIDTLTEINGSRLTGETDKDECVRLIAKATGKIHLCFTRAADGFIVMQLQWGAKAFFAPSVSLAPRKEALLPAPPKIRLRKALSPSGPVSSALRTQSAPNPSGGLESTLWMQPGLVNAVVSPWSDPRIAEMERK